MPELLDPEILLATLVYTVIGAIVFALAFWAVVKLSPFSVRKELEEDQNVALAIVIGSILIGFSIIIGAVMVSG